MKDRDYKSLHSNIFQKIAFRKLYLLKLENNDDNFENNMK